MAALRLLIEKKQTWAGNVYFVEKRAMLQFQFTSTYEKINSLMNVFNILLNYAFICKLSEILHVAILNAIVVRRFPADQAMRQRWVDAIRAITGNTLWQLKSSYAICSTNFDSDDVLAAFGRKCLKIGAVPKYQRCSLDMPMDLNVEHIEDVNEVSTTNSAQPIDIREDISVTQSIVASQSRQQSAMPLTTTPVKKTIRFCNTRAAHRLTPRSRDHPYMNIRSPKTLLMKVNCLESKLKKLQAELKCAKQQLQRKHVNLRQDRAKLLIAKAKSRKYLAAAKKYSGMLRCITYEIRSSCSANFRLRS